MESRDINELMETTPSNPFEAEDPAENYPYIRSIVDTLNSVSIPGSFASGGPFQFSAPALKIIGVEGYVGVPICEFQAKAIKAVCAQAPFGRGQETIVDTTVRNTWELDPSQFTITNPQWSSQLENLAAVVKKELGCDPKLSVKCELYKFLLYEPGSFFKPHRDTEKVDKMFGTLVIQLPSDYDGGELRVRHRNEEQIFNFSGSKGVADCNYAAFYADCEHELCEVTRGYRLCLVYNLVYSGDDACPVPIDNSEVVAKVVEDMRKWEQDDDGPKLMAYILNHSYCEASLLFGLLKNGDRAKAEIILEAEKQSKFCLYLGIVSLRQHYSTGCGHRFSPEELTARDLDEEYLDALELVSPDGKLLDSIFISRDDIVPENVFESSEPNAQDFEPFTGNEGAKLDKSYHKAALFIWPTKHTILVTDSLDGAIENLNSKLCEPQTQQGECENLAKEIVAVSKNAHFYANEQSMITLLSCLKQLKARDLTCELFKGVGVHVKILKHQSFCEMVVELGNAFGWEQLEEALVALLESAVDINMKISCNFLSSLATGSLSSQRLNVCQKMVGVVCHALTNEQDNDSINSYYMYARSKEFVVELFKTLCALQYEDQLVVVIQSFFRQPNRYSLQNTLVPAAIELHQTMKENSTTALTSLISQCVTALEQLTLQAPNWFVQNDFVTCGCKLCTKLAEFLNDPQKKVARFLTDHGHLERQLERHCHKDISFTSNYHTPSRKILVQVTKKDDRFKAHQAKLELLEHIRPLLNQKKQPVKCQKLVKSQKPPVRSQKPPVKSQKPPVKSQKPPVKRQKLYFTCYSLY